MCLIHHMEIKAAPRNRLGSPPGLLDCRADFAIPMSRVLSGCGPGIRYMSSWSRQELSLLGESCSLQHMSMEHEGYPSLLCLIHVKAQLTLGQDVQSKSSLLHQPCGPQGILF